MNFTLTTVLVEAQMEESLPIKRGELRIKHWDRSARSRRAIKAGATCFIAGVVCVIFPLVHFFLVPALVLASPGVAYFFWNQEELIVDGSVECPRCEKPIRIAPGKPLFPLKDTCEHCQRSLVLVRVSA